MCIAGFPCLTHLSSTVISPRSSLFFTTVLGHPIHTTLHVAPCPLCMSRHLHKPEVALKRLDMPHISSLCSLKYGLTELLSVQNHAQSVTK